LTILLPPGATAGLTRKTAPRTGSGDQPSGSSAHTAKAPGALPKPPLGCWRIAVAAAGVIAAVALAVVIPYPDSPPAPVAAAPAEQAPDLGCPTPERYGTRVEFVRTPTEAAQRARRGHKLTFLLHVSGNFEEPGAT